MRKKKKSTFEHEMLIMIQTIVQPGRKNHLPSQRPAQVGAECTNDLWPLTPEVLSLNQV